MHARAAKGSADSLLSVIPRFRPPTANIKRTILMVTRQRGRLSSSFELGDEEDLGARAERLEIGGLVEGAVDRDGGFLFEVVAQARVELVHRLDDCAQVFRLDREFAHPAGVAAAKAGGEDDPRGHCFAPF